MSTKGVLSWDLGERLLGDKGKGEICCIVKERKDIAFGVVAFSYHWSTLGCEGNLDRLLALILFPVLVQSCNES